MLFEKTEILFSKDTFNNVKVQAKQDLTALASQFENLPLAEQEKEIRAACEKSYKQADQNKHTTFCLKPVFLDGFPEVGLTRVVTQSIYKYLTRNKSQIEKIIICVDTQEHFTLFEKEVFGYFNHLIKGLRNEPFVTVDVIIELSQGIVIIERSNPPFGWALPGGFVDFDESLEAAVVREAKEETNLDLKDLRQFHTYSDPSRDPRFHTVDTVFVAKGVGKPQFGDDAKNLKIVPFDELLKGIYAFDHGEIIKEYLKQKNNF